MEIVRTATLDDIGQLIKMRWDFTTEYSTDDIGSYEQFYTICRQFLVEAINSKRWFIWICELEGQIVSHMYVELIQKVPRPGKSTEPHFGYVTNVYTKPQFRGLGFGKQLNTKIEAWSKEMDLEFLLVWPSETSIQFYKKSGFQPCTEAMEKHL